MYTLNTALELPVVVEYDCLDEDAIEIIGIKYKGSNLSVKFTDIQYDSLIDQINADLAAQKVEADEFKAESMRDDSKHNPNW